MGGTIPKYEVATSLRLISMGIWTAKNLAPPHAWEPRFVPSSF